MFVACGIWCLADVSSVSPSSHFVRSCVVLVLEKINREYEFQNKGSMLSVGWHPSVLL